MTLCYTPIQLILQMLYICYRSWVKSSFARAILVIAHQNPYFSSKLIQTSFTGTIRETSTNEVKAQFETNFFGTVRVMQAVIPIRRKQRSGKIVNITSIGGRMAVPFHSGYHGTKFAVEGLSESTR